MWEAAERLRALLRAGRAPLLAPEAPPDALLLALDLGDGLELQDFLACLLLSEVVYKAAEAGGPPAAAAALGSLRAELPRRVAPHLEAVQWCRRGAPHRYLLARGGGALYVACQGTKDARDVLADVNLLSRLLWEAGEAPGDAAAAAAAAATQAGAAAAASEAAAAAADAAAAAAPAVHRGVLARAVGVPIEALYAHARRQGLRLVLCGHSLGGAVAQLCALRLLRLLGGAPPPPAALRCISFGAPAVGNAALAQHVAQEGWDARFVSVAMPEDPVPRLLLQAQLQQPSQAAEPPADPALASLAAGQQQQEQQLQQRQVPQQHVGAAEADAPAAPSSRLPPALWASASTRAAAVVALAQRPLAAAGGAARTAARTARAGVGMLRSPSLLPAYLHLGQLRHLRPHGVVAAASMPALPTLAEQQQQQQQPQQWRPQLLHSMQHYRGRVVALCWQHAGMQHSGPGDDGAPPEVALSGTLAPLMTVQHAAALLPVLPLATPSQQQQPVQLTVAVRGSGLEGCTGATLRLPGMLAAQPAVQIDNPARAHLMQQLSTASSSGASGRGIHGWLAAAQRRVQQRGRRQTQQEPPPGLLLRFAVPAAALLQLHAQQQHADAAAQSSGGSQGAAWALPAAALTLLSDFGKTGTQAELQPRVVWLLGLDAALAAAAWQQLQAGAAGPAEQQQELRQRLWARLPLRAAAPLHGLASAAGSGAAAAGSRLSSVLPWPGSSSASMSVPGAAGLPPPTAGNQAAEQPEQLHTSPATPSSQTAYTAGAAQRLSRLRQQLAERLPTLAGGLQQAARPPLLWRGLLLLDASAALAAGGGSGSNVAQQLDAAAEALLWAARWRRQHDGGGRQQGSFATEAAGWDSEAGEEEMEDEDVAELRHLSPAAQLRRQVARAARGAAARRRRALLRLRWRRGLGGLRDGPLPGMVLLLVQHKQLLSRQFGEGLDAEVLASLRRLAGACQTCSSGGGGAPLLLAVASAAPLSTPYRQQLAVSVGLADSDSSTSRRGSVVPLLLQSPVAAVAGWSTAAAAQAGAPAGALHAAPLEASLLAFGRAAEKQATASMQRSKL